ncbi:DUF2062 domain-containing protein [Candidatus Dependentiae bacterium]|nr:DUF2062 domain-containing protein [Candidatus Dependentiae bacterium]
MQILEKIKNVLKKAFTQGWSVEKLTLSFCMGVYIAFSPFPGAHTIMMFIAKWLFNINFPILFIATSINNPWTMVPFYSFDYAFGYWFMHKLLGINPGWAIPLAKIFGSGKICVWSFFIGGNILGIFMALLSYPFVKMVFKKLVLKFDPMKQN